MYGKISTLIKSDGTVIAYRYDAGGNRTVKAVTKGGVTSSTYYVRDAQGNVLAVYEGERKTEQHLYGSSRLGIFDAVSGSRRYELSNHLGNVVATIGDQKVGVASITDSSLVDHYDAQVLSQTDYYPGGMTMPGRSYTTTVPYRYGFNGKEDEGEVSGWQDYGMRTYDKRVGRFVSVDPLKKKYPYYSSYQFSGNNPIRYIDLDGL